MSLRPASERERAAVVGEAETWCATPYMHLGDGEQRAGRQLKGVAIDCAQILVETYASVGVIDWFSTGRYPKDWMLHQGEERYVDFILQFGEEFDWRATPPLPGDIVVFKLGRTFSHGGIVTGAEPLTIVHAYALYEFVAQDVVAKTPLGKREMRAFTLWER